MSDSEAVFRLHEHVLLKLGGKEVPVDRRLGAVVDALWQLGIQTQSCCEQDYVIVRGRPVLSEHAYIGFTGTEHLRRFLEVLSSGVEDGDAFHAVLAAAEVAEPGRGRELETYEDFHLLAIGDRWATANKVWPMADDLVLVTAYLGFPRRELPWIEAVLTAAAS